MSDHDPIIPSFRKILDDAKGSSEFVIAVILDVRGFSSFAMKVESVETTAFLKRIYKEMIDKYFYKATFIKPTGDGLLLAFPYEEVDLPEVASYVMNACIDCLSNFTNLCDGDDMINFETPNMLGIGISRGAATKLVANGSIIDYSGRPFNIASRLMELARPSGIVLDWNFGKNLIPQEVSDRFETADVYLRGVTSDALTKILYTKDSAEIPPEKMIMPKMEWKTDETKKKLASWKLSAKTFRITLDAVPADKSKILVEARYESQRNKANETVTTFSMGFSYENHGGKPMVILNPHEVLKDAIKDGLQDDDDLTILIYYPIIKKS